MPEITDQELALANRALSIINGLQGNPDARAHLERGLKVLDPKVETQEDITARAAAPYVAQLEELKKRWDDRETAEAAAATKRAEEAALAKLEDGFGRLKTAGVTDEGLEKIKALMQERTIPDPEAAFALFQRNNPPAPEPPAGYSPPSWNYEADLMPNAKDWFTNTDAAEEQAIAGALAEVRRGSQE